MPHAPETLYRLWCGGKRYSRWTRSLDVIERIGQRHGIIYSNGALGPLTWLERGERTSPKSKTVPVGRGLSNDELARREAARRERRRAYDRGRFDGVLP